VRVLSRRIGKQTEHERVNLQDRMLARVTGVAKRLDGRAVLDHVDLGVSAGEIVTIIGPNGAGKTTLLRILLGLAKADGGSVWHKPGLRVGYVPQIVKIDDTLPLPVRRFLTLGGSAPAGRLLAALDEVGAGHILDSPVQGISGGEMRRVLLARALLREPELLVLDEPVQGVDVAGQADLFNVILAIRNKRGCGVLMVSHDLHLVMAATDIVVCLNHHVCCTGRPEAVKADPAYLSLFGPKVAGALALYAHHHDHTHDASGGVVHDHAHHHHDHAHDHGHRHG
jgi:zinc transport system ATP-binding protein